MIKESVTKALGDANVKYTDLKQAVVGYVYGEFLLVFIHNTPHSVRRLEL